MENVTLVEMPNGKGLVTLVEMPNGKGLVTLDKCHPGQSVRALHTIIKNLLVLQQGANDGCELSANMASAVVAQINNRVECGIKEPVEQVEDVVEFLDDEVECGIKGDSTIIVYDFIDYILPTKEGVPVKENDQPEKWTNLRVINFTDLVAFDNATGCFEGDDLMDAYAQWYGKGKGAYPCNNKVESVVTEQVEDDVEFIEDEYIQRKWSDLTEEEKNETDYDETAEEDIKRECLSMLQKLSWIPPLHSLELEINHVHNLFSEWDYMREQGAIDRGTQLHKEMTDYLDNMETYDNLQAEIMEVSQLLIAAECILITDDKDDDDEDDTPQHFNVPREHNDKLNNLWYHGTTDIFEPTFC